MNKLSGIKKTKQLLTGSLIALFFPFYIIILMLYTNDVSKSRTLGRETFFSYFPSFLQNSLHLTGLATMCCIIAFVLGFMALPRTNKWLQTAALFVMCISSLLIALFVFWSM